MKEEIIDLLKSGNFTLIYWDNESPSLYKGHWDKDEEYDRDEYATMNTSEIKFEGYTSGYTPFEVEY